MSVRWNQPAVEPAAYEAALAEAQTLNAMLLDASGDCIVILDPQGDALSINPGGVAAMGLPGPEAVLGPHWLALWAAPDRSQIGEALALARSGGAGRFQGLCPTGSGAPRWWDVVVAPLVLPGAASTRLVAVGRDVTAFRERDEQARQLAGLVEQSTDFIGIADPDGRVVFVNPAGRRMLGDAAGTAPGPRLIDYVAPEDRDIITRTVLPAVRQRGYWEGALSFRRFDDGARLPVHHTIFPLRDAAGAVTGYGTVTRDRRELQKSDARRTALLELGDRLGATDEPDEMSFIAAEIMGRALGASTAGYGTMSDDDAFFELQRDWTAPGIASIGRRLLVEDYGSFYAELRRGETVAIADVRLDPRTAASAPTLEAISARGFVNLPLIERGRLVALFFVLDASPHGWTDDDVAFIRNVAERTRSAIERRRAESRLRELASSLEQQVAERTRERDQVWQSSRDLLCVANFDGYLVSLNPAWSATLGWTRDELRQRPFLEFVHPDDHAGTLAAAAGLTAGQAQLSFENRYRCRDGSYRWLSWNAVPQDGLIYASVRDVTVEKRQAGELRRSRATLRSIFETSYQLQALLGTDGRVIEANAVSLDVIDARLEDVAGRLFWQTPWFDRTPGVPERVEAAFAAAARGEGSQMSVSLNVARGLRSFDFSIRPLRDAAGSVVAVVSEAVDTTERLLAEEKLRQSQKMEAVGQLTGGLAHDFNNLLTGISGSLELLQTRLAQGRINDVDRYVSAAQGAARRAAALTHRLLAFSRRQTLEPKPTDANRLVTGLEELIRRTVGPEVMLEVVTAGGLWNTLVDPSQLENALLNLCINARDAMPEGGRLTIETGNKWLDQRAAEERELPPGQYVSLCVSDNGSGMPPEVIARAFDPFFTTKPIGQGTGLGLSMIYGFVRQSGGQVRIYSELGAGTTVCLYLPRHLGEAAEAESPAELSDAPRARSEETVLVVDDEPTVRMLVTEVLEDLGYTAIEAADGAAGLRVLGSDARIDLLVTDVGLPGGMNGRQLADAARAVRPGLRVLFITGYAENAVLSHGHLDSGMHVLTKPFAMEALASRIRSLIS